MTQMRLLLAFVLSFLLNAGAAIAGPSANLRRAATLYALSLATDSDSAALREAHESYGRAMAELDGPGEAKTPEKVQLRAAAQAGLNQTAARLENSDEMFRNVWPGAWMLQGDHGVYERYDSGVELALDRAWSGMVDRLEFRYPRTTPVYPRCTGDEDNCEILRDMVLLSAAKAPHLRPVTDDEFAAYQTRASLGVAGDGPHISDKLGRDFPDNYILISDIEVLDVTNFGDTVYRVGVRVAKVNLRQDTAQTVAHGTAVAVDVIDRWHHSLLVASLLGLGMLVVSVLLKLHPAGLPAAFLCVALGLAGGGMMFGAGEVLDLVRPAMGDLAWDPGGRPLLSTWVWPVCLGVLLSGGAVGVTAILRGTLAARLQGLVDLSQIRWEVAGLPVAIGAIILVCFDLPTLFGGAGVFFVGGLIWSLSLSTLGIGRLVFSPRVSLGGTRVRIALLIAICAGTGGVVASLLGLPLLWVVATGLLCLPALRVQSEVSQDTIRQGGDSAATEQAQADTGSLDIPTFVECGQDVVAQRLAGLSDGEGLSVIHFSGISGTGKTRSMLELIDRMPCRSKREQLVAMARPSSGESGDSPPYEALAQLLREVLPVLSHIESMERAAQASASLSEAGGAILDSMPGVGLILGLLPEGGEEAGAVRLKADVLEAVQKLLSQRDLVWFMDDVDHADEESWDAIVHILEQLGSNGTEGGRLVLLLTSQTRDDDRVNRLDNILSTIHQTELRDLSEGDTQDLVEATGMARPSPAQAMWVAGHGNSPGATLSVLRHLKATEQLVQNDNGRPALPGINILEALADPVPRGLIDRELRRLEDLTNEQILFIQMAAQCGQQFEASDLAAGLSEGRMKVLGVLRGIEEQRGLIEDRNEDDCFSFLMRITHQALLHRTRTRTRRGGQGAEDHLPEFVRAFHAQVAAHLKEGHHSQDRPVSAEKIHRHLSMAGPGLAREAPVWALLAAEQAATLASWPRARTWVAQAERDLINPEPAILHRLDFVRAKAWNASGEQSLRDQARDVFKSLIESPHVDARQALLLWLEITYEEKESRRLIGMQQNLQALAQTNWTHDLMNETVRFYAILVDGQLGPGNNENHVQTEALLSALVKEVRQADSEAGSRFGDLLRSRIYNEIALKLFLLDGDDIASDRDARFYDALERSMEIKLRHGDLAGQAACLGLKGDFLYFELSNLKEARHFYEKDLELLERMGDQNKQASLFNKIGLTIYNDDSIPERVELGLDKARRSLALAVELEREVDVFFAGCQIVEIAVDHRLSPEDWEAAVEAIQRPGLLAEVRSEGKKLGLRASLGMLEHGEDSAYRESIQRLMDLLPRPSEEEDH